MLCYHYPPEAIDYLTRRDKRLGQAIAAIGPIEREVHPQLYAALVNSIVGQQISGRAAQTVWQRLCERFGAITPQALAKAEASEIQAMGMSMRKAQHIVGLTQRALTDPAFLEEACDLPDEAFCQRMQTLPGVGRWTAEMLLIFCLQRPDVVSFGDFGIRRGMRMLYRHRVLDRERFERYRRRYAPYGTVASLYLWAIAGGALPGLTDPGATPTVGHSKRGPAAK